MSFEILTTLAFWDKAAVVTMIVMIVFLVVSAAMPGPKTEDEPKASTLAEDVQAIASAIREDGTLPTDRRHWYADKLQDALRANTMITASPEATTPEDSEAT